jgi:hypothetical protein
MQLDPNILSEFKQITGKDIAGYFINAMRFFNGDYSTIVNYYSGITSTISSKPFANFDTLKQQNKDVLETFKEHSRQFNNLKWFLLIEQIEEVDNRLQTLSKINKWARSSLTKVAYDPSFQVEYVMKQNQTLENVASNIEGSQNPNDDWVDIALQNRLSEEDYTPEGGTNVNLSFKRLNVNFNINAVVDVISGKSVYGKDINRQLQFDGDNNDLKVLGYDDTILQAADILANLRKGDNPDNPDHGLQANVIAGGNKAIFNFPVITRQMSASFSNDDTLKNFTINNLSIDQDNLACDYTVATRIGEVIQNGVLQ